MVAFHTSKWPRVSFALEAVLRSTLMFVEGHAWDHGSASLWLHKDYICIGIKFYWLRSCWISIRFLLNKVFWIWRINVIILSFEIYYATNKSSWVSLILKFPKEPCVCSLKLLFPTSAHRSVFLPPHNSYLSIGLWWNKLLVLIVLKLQRNPSFCRTVNLCLVISSDVDLT